MKLDAIINSCNYFYKRAIFNDFWLQSNLLSSTDQVAADLYDAVDIDKINELSSFIYFLEDLFNKIVYFPTHHKNMNLNDEDYLYQFSRKKLESLFHDMIHETLDPGITEEFVGEGYEPEEGWDLYHYMSEHQAQFIGDKGDTTYLKYGIQKYIANKLRNKIYEIIQINKEELEKNFNNKEFFSKIFQEILDIINDDISNLKDSLQPVAKYLILDTAKKIIYQYLTYPPKNFLNIIGTFWEALDREVQIKFNKVRKKTTSPQILSEQELACANRIRLFFNKINNLISSGKINEIIASLPQS